METWRLSRIQDELDHLDFNMDTTDSRNSKFATCNTSDTNNINNKLTMSNPVRAVAMGTVAKLVGDEGFTDDEDSLPPYPEVEHDSMIHDYGDFPTPVPAQIGIVRPLPGLSKQQPPPKEDIYSETFAKPIKAIFADTQAAKVVAEKYDSVGKVKPKYELDKIPDGYINMHSSTKVVNSPTKVVNSPTKIVPKRVAPPPPQPEVTTAFSLTNGRSLSDSGHSFSEIIQIRSPSRAIASLSLSDDDIPPVIQEQSVSPDLVRPLMPEQLQSPTRGSRELSWTEMDPRSSPSKAVLPVDLTGYQNSSIKKAGNTSSLMEHEILQIEMFYRSHKSQVFVSHCMADLYYGSIKNMASADNFYSSGLDSLSNWKLIKPGIPLLLLDSGESRRERKLYLIVAERGTGFALWKDEFNHLTDYQSREALFHTMHLSTDHSKLAAFKFYDAVGASGFLQNLNAIITNPDMEDILNLSGKKKKKEKKSSASKSKKKLPNKTAISAPCCFTHITNLDRNDGLGVLDIASSSATKEQK